MSKKQRDEMTEEELAEYVEARKDDVSSWEAVSGPPIRVRRGGASSVFSVRLSTDELRKVQVAAQRRRVTVSGFIRDAALEAASDIENEGVIVQMSGNQPRFEKISKVSALI